MDIVTKRPAVIAEEEAREAIRELQRVLAAAADVNRLYAGRHQAALRHGVAGLPDPLPAKLLTELALSLTGVGIRLI